MKVVKLDSGYLSYSVTNTTRLAHVQHYAQHMPSCGLWDELIEGHICQ
jgi:hypothetical protein